MQSVCRDNGEGLEMAEMVWLMSFTGLYPVAMTSVSQAQPVMPDCLVVASKGLYERGMSGERGRELWLLGLLSLLAAAFQPGT